MSGGDPITRAPATDAATDDRFARGLEVRREVLGAAYVDAALADACELDEPLQHLVTSYAWGSVWARPGLDRRTRSAVTIALLALLNRPDELALHVRAALGNGLTRGEVAEVLLHTAVYGGMPVALGGFRVAREVFDEQPS